MLSPGDSAIVPDPCYPIHRYGVLLTGAHLEPYRVAPGHDPLAALEQAFHASPSRPRLAIVNYPHNPTSATIDARAMQGIVQWAERHDLWLISDLAYADLVFDGGRAPSALAVPGASRRTVEVFTTSKSFNMAGWRVGFCVGNRELVAALKRVKGYYDYGIFGAVQRAAIAALDGGDRIAAEVCELYRDRARSLAAGLGRAGWPVAPPLGTMFLWATLPARFRALSSVDFAVRLLDEARVAVAPGAAFGPGGEGAVRFGLVEELPRIEQACASIGKLLS
jgi:alanine-synthesizing transaminase